MSGIGFEELLADVERIDEAMKNNRQQPELSDEDLPSCQHGVMVGRCRACEDSKRIDIWRTEALDQGMHVNRLKGLLDRACRLLERTLPTFPVDKKIIHDEIRVLVSEADVWLRQPGALASDEDKAKWLAEAKEKLPLIP